MLKIGVLWRSFHMLLSLAVNCQFCTMGVLSSYQESFYIVVPPTIWWPSINGIGHLLSNGLQFKIRFVKNVLIATLMLWSFGWHLSFPFFFIGFIHFFFYFYECRHILGSIYGLFYFFGFRIWIVTVFVENRVLRNSVFVSVWDVCHAFRFWPIHLAIQLPWIPNSIPLTSIPVATRLIRCRLDMFSLLIASNICICDVQITKLHDSVHLLYARPTHMYHFVFDTSIDLGYNFHSVCTHSQISIANKAHIYMSIPT